MYHKHTEIQIKTGIHIRTHIHVHTLLQTDRHTHTHTKHIDIKKYFIDRFFAD